jgi:hypothetical protein
MSKITAEQHPYSTKIQNSAFHAWRERNDDDFDALRLVTPDPSVRKQIVRERLRRQRKWIVKDPDI